MAITKGAKKAHRASQKKRVYNIRRKKTLHDTVQALRREIAVGAVDKAHALTAATQKAIDKAAKRGVIKPRTAARKKSRLARAIARVAEKKA
jgi:small subunit ribosomal protein S20